MAQEGIMEYLCKLIENGIVHESFYRCGSSPEEVKEGLEMFVWPDGQWKIEEIDEGRE